MNADLYIVKKQGAIIAIFASYHAARKKAAEISGTVTPYVIVKEARAV